MFAEIFVLSSIVIAQGLDEFDKAAVFVPLSSLTTYSDDLLSQTVFVPDGGVLSSIAFDAATVAGNDIFTTSSAVSVVLTTSISTSRYSQPPVAMQETPVPRPGGPDYVTVVDTIFSTVDCSTSSSSTAEISWPSAPETTSTSFLSSTWADTLSQSTQSTANFEPIQTGASIILPVSSSTLSLVAVSTKISLQPFYVNSTRVILSKALVTPIPEEIVTVVITDWSTITDTLVTSTTVTTTVSSIPLTVIGGTTFYVLEPQCTAIPSTYPSGDSSLALPVSSTSAFLTQSDSIPVPNLGSEISSTSNAASTTLIGLTQPPTNTELTLSDYTYLESTSSVSSSAATISSAVTFSVPLSSGADSTANLSSGPLEQSSLQPISSTPKSSWLQHRWVNSTIIPYSATVNISGTSRFPTATSSSKTLLSLLSESSTSLDAVTQLLNDQNNRLIENAVLKDIVIDVDIGLPVASLVIPLLPTQVLSSPSLAITTAVLTENLISPFSDTVFPTIPITPILTETELSLTLPVSIPETVGLSALPTISSPSELLLIPIATETISLPPIIDTILSVVLLPTEGTLPTPVTVALPTELTLTIPLAVPTETISLLGIDSILPTISVGTELSLTVPVPTETLSLPAEVSLTLPLSIETGLLTLATIPVLTELSLTLSVPTEILSLPTLSPISLPTEVSLSLPLSIETELLTLATIPVLTELSLTLPIPTETLSLPAEVSLTLPLSIETGLLTLATIPVLTELSLTLSVPTEILSLPTLSPISLPTEVSPLSIETELLTIATIPVLTELSLTLPIPLPTETIVLPTLPTIALPTELSLTIPLAVPTETISLPGIDSILSIISVPTELSLTLSIPIETIGLPTLPTLATISLPTEVSLTLPIPIETIALPTLPTVSLPTGLSLTLPISIPTEPFISIPSIVLTLPTIPTIPLPSLPTLLTLPPISVPTLTLPISIPTLGLPISGKGSSLFKCSNWFGAADVLLCSDSRSSPQRLSISTLVIALAISLLV